MITSVLNTYHPFLAQIPYTHAHTPTHLVPVCLPYNLRLLIVLLIVLLWLNQIVYVCVCAHVCVCRLCVLRVYTVYMTRLIKAHEPREPAAGMCIKVGETINLHIPSM